MSSATRLVAVLLFWALIGITWAILNEQIVSQIPTMFPEPIAQDGETWSIMNFIWTISIIGLAIGSGMSILGQRALKGAIVSGIIIFCGMFTLIFLWASFWNVANVTIPNAFSTGFGTTSNEKANLGIYDASFEVLMLGLMLCSLLLGGSITIGTGRRRRAFKSAREGKTFRPKYAYVYEKKVYGYRGKKQNQYSEIAPSRRLKLVDTDKDNAWK